MMRPTLLDTALDEEFDALGFVVIPFLADDEIEFLSNTYREFGPAPGDTKLSIYFDFQSDSREYKEAVVSATSGVLAENAKHVLNEFELFFPDFIMKWPGHRSGFAPHMDVTFIDESKFRSVSIWSPLVDATPGDDGSGVLCVVPGSHRFVSWPQAYLPDFPFSGLEQSIIEEFGLAVPVRRGEAVVFDHRLVHYSLPNNSGRPRLAIDGNFRPREAELFHYRPSGDESFELYRIDEEFFLSCNPVSLMDGPPACAEFSHTLNCDRPEVDYSELARLSSEVDLSRSGVPLVKADITADAPSGRQWYVMENDDWRSRPVPFCHYCGTEDDLEVLQQDELGAVLYRCGSCAIVAEGAGDERNRGAWPRSRARWFGRRVALLVSAARARTRE